MSPVLDDPELDAALSDLHEASTGQDAAVERYFFHDRIGPWNGMELRDHAFMADKMIALDRDKGEFCYMLCRAIGARRIVEVGTSCGVSTLYLAAAVRDNGGGVVFGAEYEPVKVSLARANFDATGLAPFIELHEADLIEAAAGFAGPIDFVLIDIWGQVVQPVLDLLLPKLRAGAVICTDGTGGEQSLARDGLYAALENAPHGFRTMTLPFKSGLELSIKL